jgi:DNA-binding response OmpR family regulator
MKIILLSQDQLLINRISSILSHHHFLVDAVPTTEKLEHYMEAFPYDLMIFDAKTPDLEILSYSKKLQSIEHPLMLLLLFQTLDEKLEVKGFNSGADGCLERDFSDALLAAYVRALLRRRGEKYPVIGRWGDLLVDCDSQTVTYAGRLIPLTPKEYQMLTVFLAAPHKTFNSQVMIDQAWNSEMEQPNVETVKMHIRALRTKFKKVGLDGLIETVHGFGYRINQVLLSSMVAQS